VAYFLGHPVYISDGSEERIYAGYP